VTWFTRFPSHVLHVSRAWHWLHLFPGSAMVACFPALGTGRMIWLGVLIGQMCDCFGCDFISEQIVVPGGEAGDIGGSSVSSPSSALALSLHKPCTWNRDIKIMTWFFFFDLRVTCMLNNFFTKITFAAFGMAYKAKLNIFRRLFENHSDVTNSFSRKFSHTCDREFHLLASSEKCPPAIQTFLVISECYAKISDENLTRPSEILSWLMVATDMTFLNSLIFP